MGLSGAILGSGLFCSIGYWNRPWFQRIRRRFYAISIPLVLLLYGVPAILAPSDSNTDPCIQSCFLNEQRTYCRFSPCNVMPEADHINLAMTLCPTAEPQMTFAEAARMRSLTVPLYDAMNRDTGFCDLGSTFELACRDLFHLPFPTNHYFVVMPSQETAEAASSGDAGKTADSPTTRRDATSTTATRLPCLLFLHGQGGNAKAYPWLFSRLARQQKCIVIHPTFGMGNWDNPKGAAMVVAVAREAIQKLPIDPKRIFLMGYSNGGMGVTRAAIVAPELFQGLIYLSPVTEDELFATQEFQSRVNDRKLLFLHGDQDRRIPRQFVEGTVASLRQRAHNVRLRVYADEDHWLLFSQPQAILDEVWEFMTPAGHPLPQTTREAAVQNPEERHRRLERRSP